MWFSEQKLASCKIPFLLGSAPQSCEYSVVQKIQIIFVYIIFPDWNISLCQGHPCSLPAPVPALPRVSPQHAKNPFWLQGENMGRCPGGRSCHFPCTASTSLRDPSPEKKAGAKKRGPKRRARNQHLDTSLESISYKN